jgi:hypothetical protein
MYRASFLSGMVPYILTQCLQKELHDAWGEQCVTCSHKESTSHTSHYNTRRRTAIGHVSYNQVPATIAVPRRNGNIWPLPSFKNPATLQNTSYISCANQQGRQSKLPRTISLPQLVSAALNAFKSINHQESRMKWHVCCSPIN